MAKTGFDRTVNRLDNAVTGSMQRIDRVIGKAPDADRIFYESLTSDDFAAIAQEYGVDGLADYVKELEIKKIKEQHAN